MAKTYGPNKTRQKNETKEEQQETMEPKQDELEHFERILKGEQQMTQPSDDSDFGKFTTETSMPNPDDSVYNKALPPDETFVEGGYPEPQFQNEGPAVMDDSLYRRQQNQQDVEADLVGGETLSISESEKKGKDSKWTPEGSKDQKETPNTPKGTTDNLKETVPQTPKGIPDNPKETPDNPKRIPDNLKRIPDNPKETKETKETVPPSPPLQQEDFIPAHQEVQIPKHSAQTMAHNWSKELEYMQSEGLFRGEVPSAFSAECLSDGTLLLRAVQLPPGVVLVGAQPIEEYEYVREDEVADSPGLPATGGVSRRRRISFDADGNPQG